MLDLNKFDNSWYKPANKVKIILWYFINMFMFKTLFPIPSSIKVKVLRLFGAEVGNAVVIKPNVNIKYPWFLTIGDNCWIGEEVWIDNLAQVTIGNNVCLSQGSYLLTGSHDYKKEAFDLMLGEIVLEDGVWIGAKAIVCPNVTCKSHSVLVVGSVATKNLDEYGIYQGNPAQFKRKREIT
ncbi:WcaF family extracellular polysaccharide biosynthesis acetyltransferase [Patescibacteria group bacterium]|nr:WcaF family extracellular polysaccharide biosynthesis acetyltransferase [Patescibacteria group bacterium]